MSKKFRVIKVENLITEAELQAERLVREACAAACIKGRLPEGMQLECSAVMTKNPEYGDITCSYAAAASKKTKMSPQEVAKTICGELVLNGSFFERAESAANGLINLRLSDKWYAEVLTLVREVSGRYGSSDSGKGRRAIAAFMPCGSAGVWGMNYIRGGIICGNIASVLEKTGYDVQKELYLYNAGIGTDIFETTMPDGLKSLKTEYDRLIKAPEQDGIGYAADALNVLIDNGIAYEKDGVIYFNLTGSGNETGEALRLSDGTFTPFALCLTYLRYSLTLRGYDRAVAVTDTEKQARYIAQIIKILPVFGIKKDRLTVMRIGAVRLSGGSCIAETPGELEEALACRYSGIHANSVRFLLGIKPENDLELDLDLAARCDGGNPAYYIQYALKRLDDLTKRLRNECMQPVIEAGTVRHYNETEKALIKQIARYLEEIMSAASFNKPSLINRGLTELASGFYRFYYTCKIRDGRGSADETKLRLMEAVRIVLDNGLRLLGMC